MKILEVRRRPYVGQNDTRTMPKIQPEWPRWAGGRSCTVAALFLGPEARKPQTEDSELFKLAKS